MKSTNKIKIFADKIRNYNVPSAELEKFIARHLPRVRKHKLKNLDAYLVAHALFEEMVEKRQHAEAILESPEDWGCTEKNKDEAAQDLRNRAEDFYTIAEFLLMVAWY